MLDAQGCDQAERLLEIGSELRAIANEMARERSEAQPPCFPDVDTARNSSGIKLTRWASRPESFLIRHVKPALPDPRLVRRIIRHRQMRAKYFACELFADPAWDMLLDLAVARVEHRRVSVTSLCIASGVPPTTALRWMKQMLDAGILQKIEDDTDRRRAFVSLTDSTAFAIARYFADIELREPYPI